MLILTKIRTESVAIKCHSIFPFHRMWREIREKAKLELLHILFMMKVNSVDENSAQSIDEITPSTIFKELPTKIVLNQWKYQIDLFTENGFI